MKISHIHPNDPRHNEKSLIQHMHNLTVLLSYVSSKLQQESGSIFNNYLKRRGKTDEDIADIQKKQARWSLLSVGGGAFTMIGGVCGAAGWSGTKGVCDALGQAAGPATQFITQSYEPHKTMNQSYKVMEDSHHENQKTINQFNRNTIQSVHDIGSSVTQNFGRTLKEALGRR